MSEYWQKWVFWCHKFTHKNSQLEAPICIQKYANYLLVLMAKKKGLSSV